MENTLAVAKFMFDEYESRFHKKMDELKMHKLMYFTQRESLIVNQSALFDEDFRGWKYGPVLLSVRHQYWSGDPFESVSPTSCIYAKELVSRVLDRYGCLSSWDLSALSHKEMSWLHARNGLKVDENGDIKLSIAAMKLDAIRESVKRITSEDN